MTKSSDVSNALKSGTNQIRFDPGLSLIDNGSTKVFANGLKTA